MSSIFQTRRGFLYQDRYAVYAFLSHYINQDVKEIYIDFPLPRQKSIDIQLTDSKGCVRIYEVKIGKSFKCDLHSEIAEILLNFYQYQHHNKTTITPCLVVNDALRQQILEYWQKITAIQEYKTIRYNIERLKWLMDKLKINHKDMEPFFIFVKKLKLIVFDNDQKNNDRDENCDADSKIMDFIKDIGNTIGVKAGEEDYPIKNILNELLILCQQNAGTKTNLLNLMRQSLISYFVKRRFFDKHYTCKRHNIDNTLKHIRNDVNREFENNFDTTTNVARATVSESASLEGKVIQ